MLYSNCILMICKIVKHWGSNSICLSQNIRKKIKIKKNKNKIKT